jgi:septal ring factor EnvC (AmiA/AmiB activator)
VSQPKNPFGATAIQQCCGGCGKPLGAHIFYHDDQSGIPPVFRLPYCSRCILRRLLAVADCKMVLQEAEDAFDREHKRKELAARLEELRQLRKERAELLRKATTELAGCQEDVAHLDQQIDVVQHRLGKLDADALAEQETQTKAPG